MAACIVLKQYLEDYKILPKTSKSEGIGYSMASVTINVLPVFFHAITQRPPSKKKMNMKKLLKSTKPPTPNTKRNERNCLNRSKQHEIKEQAKQNFMNLEF